MATLEYDIAAVGQLDREIRLDVGADKPFLDVQILFNGSPIEDLTGDTVTFTMTDTNGVKKIDDIAGSVFDGPNAIVRYTWAQADVDTEAAYLGQFKIVDGASKIFLQPNNATQRLLVFIGRAEAPAINLQPPISLHGGSHIKDGLDEVDGDKIDIDFVPANYTPTVVAGIADDVNHLTAYLKGIDLGIGGAGVTDHGALTGLGDDDHAQYALADGTRGAFWRTDGGNSPTADMPAGGFKVTGLGGIQVNKVAGAAPTSAATQLGSEKVEWQTHLFKTVGGAFVRSGFLRVSPDTSIEDQHQFTFSTTDSDGTERDFLSIRRTSAGIVELRPATGQGLTLTDEDGHDIFNIKADGNWQILGFNGITVQMESVATGTVRLGANFFIKDNLQFAFGTSSLVRYRLSAEQTNNALVISVSDSASKTIIFTQVGQQSSNFGLAVQSTPTKFFHDGSSTLGNLTALAQVAGAFVIDALAASPAIDLRVSGTSRIKVDGTGIGLFTATPVAQPSTTGQTAGFTAGVGTSVLDDSTFTGGTGTKAYTVGDLVKHLKALGALASS